jgi:sugar phosphate isomerase/epimerase
LRSRGALKGRLPFRLGTTSWIVPGEVVPNVELVADVVDDVELLAFESADGAVHPAGDEVRRLRELAAAADLTYTVHLPLDARLCATGEAERRRAVGQCLAVVERYRELDPLAWVVHFEMEGGCEAGLWREAAERSARELVASGLEAGRLAAENLDYPCEFVEELSAECGISMCLDIGHLITAGRRLAEHLGRVLERCRVVHLHGVVDGRDHRDISGVDRAELISILKLAGGAGAAGRVVTLEVFSEADLAKSLAILEEVRPWDA